MPYIAFSRKYRPQTFDEVIGQEHVTETLKNAIKQDRVSHAYLFTGPRGIGKTSTARILSKSLNCTKGPTAQPCSKCPSCQDIIASRSLDVIEIDGASNRGIDEIRTLRENVKFAPSSGQFKIYIIDEVHMLTQEAFNALLKTLEEPPEHVKFIFATTMPHKVPSTILSRCQRFDFRMIPSTTLADTLKKVAAAEKITITEEAVFAIARAASGSMRDAEVILDQLASFTKGKIEYDEVIDVLGLIGEKSLMEFSDKIISGDSAGCLEIVDRIAGEGKDPVQLCWDMITHFRNLLVAKMGSKLRDLIDLPDEDIKAIFKQAEQVSVEELLYMFSILARIQDMMKRSLSPRTMLEMGLVKLTRRGDMIPAADIVERLEQLDDKLSRVKGCPPEPVAAAAPAPESPPSPAPEPAPEPAPAPNAIQVSFEEVVKIWPALIKRIKTDKMSVASYLMEANPLTLNGNNLTIAFPSQYKFHKETLEHKDNRDLIEGILNKLLNSAIRIKFTLVEAPNQEQEEAKEAEKEALIDPVIESAVEIFDGRVRKSP